MDDNDPSELEREWNHAKMLDSYALQEEQYLAEIEAEYEAWLEQQRPKETTNPQEPRPHD